MTKERTTGIIINLKTVEKDNSILLFLIVCFLAIVVLMVGLIFV